MSIRCNCTTATPGAYGVCKRCGGEYQRQHSERCDCAACFPSGPTARAEAAAARHERLGQGRARRAGDAAGPGGRGGPVTTIGTPPVLVLLDANCIDCGSVHDIEKCPDCGSWIEFGYGLAGGGCGSYKYCTNESCHWMWRQFGDDEDEAKP